MNYLSEIFGFPPENKSIQSAKVRSKFLCPFQTNGVECDPVNKKSNLSDSNGKPLLSHQTGACSVMYKSRSEDKFIPNIICPYRFLEKNELGETIIFKYVKEKFFKNKNVVFVPEVGLGEYGRADWMVCELDKNKKLINYDLLEFQSDATTGTRELVLCAKDFSDGKDITKKNYKYGLNSKASIKGSSLQMIDKGFLFEKLKRKSLWILQRPLFEILCQIYNIEMTKMKENEDAHTGGIVFIVVDLVMNKNNRYVLEVSECFSTSSNKLQEAMSKKPSIDEKKLIYALETKINSGHFIVS